MSESKADSMRRLMQQQAQDMSSEQTQPFVPPLVVGFDQIDEEDGETVDNVVSLPAVESALVSPSSFFDELKAVKPWYKRLWNWVRRA